VAAGTRIDFAAVFEVTPTPSLVLTSDAVIVAANRAALHAAATTRAELIGRSLFDAFPDDPSALGSTNLRASLDRVLRTALPDTMALQRDDVPAPGGGFTRRWWTQVNIPLLDERGRVAWVLHRSEEVTGYVDDELHASTAALGADDGASASSSGEQASGSALSIRLHRAESHLHARGQELSTALEATRRWAAQQAGLVDMARSLGEAEDEEAVLEVVARHGTRLLGAGGSALCLREPDGLHVRILVTDTVAAHVRDAVQLMPADSGLPLVHTAATGEPHFFADLADTVARFPDSAVLYADADAEASATAPLQSRGRLIGALSLACPDVRAWPQQERDLVTAFAALTAQALDRITARDGERAASATAARFSETLQRSMLTHPPQPDHLQLVVRYTPAAALSQVGGDWYDAYLTPGGSTSLIIGDVAGHDQNAAATMGQLRNLLRGIGQALGDPPALVLSALDRAAHNLGVDGLATIVLAQVEQPDEHAAAGTRLLRWSNAGHPPPLLIEPGSGTRFLDAGVDLMVGIDPDTSRHDHEVVLAPGATVLFYTDGLIERRGESLDDGMAWLAQAAEHLSRPGRPGESSQPGRATLDELVDGLLELVGGQVEDDVALLALRAHPEDVPRPSEAGANIDPRREPTLDSAEPGDVDETMATTDVDVRDDSHVRDTADPQARQQGETDGSGGSVLVLDPDPAAVRRARTFVHDCCCRLQMSDDVCETLTLLVSEVVTNAISHGRSRAWLRVIDLTGVVRVEVSDDDSRLPVLSHADPDALGGRGLAMVDLLASAWGVREEAVGKTVWMELSGQRQ
jgi:serine phosphatase RsbU (regulator of sigma subunit)/anti-sigma regulatory factor (Ser/Thr protein kinase)